MRTNRSWTVLLALGALAHCASEPGDVADDDPSHTTVPEDAAGDLGALLPENDGTDAALDAPDDAALDVSEDAAPDVAPAVDAAPDVRVDVALDRPVDAPRDAAPDVAPRCTGSASGQSSIWTCTVDRTARQRCDAGSTQTERCPWGCVARPSGTDDTCAPMATSLPACARQSLLRWGLHPDASDHLRCAGVTAARITQTIGNAEASAGTHARDGYVAGAPYSAATDISTRGLSTADIRTLLSRLADHGFAAWYRWPGHDGWPASEAPHIHAVYVGCAMKSSLRAQVSDWLVGRNGLRSHATYTFYTWSAAQRTLVRAVYGRFN